MKSLALLSVLFPENSGDDGVSRQTFRTAMAKYFGDEGYFDGDRWGIFEDESTNAKKLLKAMAAGKGGSLKRAMFTHFSHNTEEVAYGDEEKILPYLRFTSSTFGPLYGPHKNNYVSAYLTFLYEQGKPMFSYLIGEELSGEDEVYDYTQYGLISQLEGEALAEAVLRYYTWGVEYTGYGTDSLSLTGTDSPIYENANLRTVLEIWTKIDRDTPEWNYLQHEPKSVETGQSGGTGDISPVHVMDDGFIGNDLTIAGFPEIQEALEISRIDILSSRNIVWDDGRVKEVLLEGEILAEGSDNKAVIHDRKLHLGAQGNLVLEKSTTEEITVSFGYEFGNVEELRGILLITGSGERTQGVPDKTEFIKQDLFSIQISPSESGEDWETITPVKAYAFDPKLYRYSVLTDAPGWSIASGAYYTDSSTQMGYSYFVLPQGTKGKRIQIVDSMKSSKITISEMMVFNDDPLRWLDGITIENDEIKHKDLFNGTNPATVTPQASWHGVSGKDALYLLSNGNLDSVYYSIPADGNNIPHLTFHFDKSKPMVEIESIIVWEKDHTGGISALEQEVLVMEGTSEILDSGYFAAYHEIESEVQHLLTTPFYQSLGPVVFNIQPGNPLPYASKGIDSPRTFNYKMFSQAEARDWYVTNNTDRAYRFTDKETTLALDGWGKETYQYGYVSEVDILKTLNPGADVRLSGNLLYNDTVDDITQTTTARPFLPGRQLTVDAGYISNSNSPYQADKIAGVDALGMLMGSIAMTNLRGRVLNIENDATAAELNNYFRMNEKAPGLDEEGKPIFYAPEGESFLDGSYRFTRTDFERNTVLVPDLSLIQMGDLIMKYDTDGEPHIGIVVAFDDTVLSDTGKTTEEKLQAVTVISTRRGFNHVTLGKWGNSGNSFGGFSTDPESYQVRRLLKLTGTAGSTISEVAWEMVVEPPMRRYWDYAMYQNVARTNSRVYGDVENECTIEWESTRVNKIKSYYYYKYMPPTSFTNKLIDASIFQDYEIMVMTNLTGWRNINYADTGETPEYRTTYHRGLDVVPIEYNGKGKVIIAPEDGEFWFLDTFTGSEYIKFEEGKGIPIEKYNLSYGNIGVFITNPTDRRSGRVYVFAHQVWSDLISQYNSEPYFENDGVTQKSFPDAYEKRISVKKGDWIGIVGDEGLGAAHVHIDVYEFFQDYDLSQEENLSSEFNQSCYRWQRVDPVTVFATERLRNHNGYNPNEVGKLMQSDIVCSWTENERKKHFQLWERFERYVEDHIQ